MTSPFEEGSPRSKICIIAEAPAFNEIRIGKPLVGRSGMLFNECLHAADLIRSDLYILNVFEFEVTKDKKTGNIYDQYGDLLWSQRTAKFTAYGLECAKGALKRLERSNANVIVPLGGVALSLLFGDGRILKWRGSILEAKGPNIPRTLMGRKLIPTIHPMYSLYGNYPWRFVLQGDLRKVREECSVPQLNLPKRELIINPSFPEVMAFLRDLRRVPRTATDIEVLNHQISCLSFAPRADFSMCIPLLDGGGRNRWTEENEAEIWLAVAAIMGDPKIEKINQNILFDIAFEFEQNNIVTRGSVQCTMCAQGIIYPDFPKGLDFICSTRTREPYYKDDGKLWSKPWIDMDRFWTYNAKDSAVALEAWDDQQKEMDGYEWTYQATIDLFPSLMFMMAHGIYVDRKRLKETNEEIYKRIQEKQAELESISEWKFNPKSPKQCQEYFYVTKGIKPYISSKTRSVTTDDKAMARIVKRYGLPEARLVQEIRHLRTHHSNFLEVGVDPDDHLRCTYNPRGTTTGRLSSSETVRKTGLNMQNLPAEFKDFMTAEPD